MAKEVVFEKLSGPQKQWLLFLKVHGTADIYDDWNENIKKALRNRGLIERKNDRYGTYVLTELGQQITPIPTEAWLKAEVAETQKQQEDANHHVKLYQGRAEYAQRRLKKLEEFQKEHKTNAHTVGCA